MNRQHTESFRQQLLSLAERLNADAAGLQDTAFRGSNGEDGGNLSNAPVHLADLASDNLDQEIAVGLLQNEQQVLRAVVKAVERLDAGTYGQCAGCGQEIPTERLKAVPYASRCVACERQQEAVEGHEDANDR